MSNCSHTRRRNSDYYSLENCVPQWSVSAHGFIIMVTELTRIIVDHNTLGSLQKTHHYGATLDKKYSQQI